MRRVRVGSRLVLGAIAVVVALQVSVIPEQAPQTPAPPTGTGLLMGTVVDGLSD